MRFSILLFSNLFSPSLLCAASFSQHNIDTVAAGRDAELDFDIDIDFATPCSDEPTCDDEIADLFDSIDGSLTEEEEEEPSIYNNALRTRSTKRSGSFQRLMSSFGRKSTNINNKDDNHKKTATPLDRKSLSSVERHLVLEFAGKIARSKQDFHSNQADASELAAKAEHQKFLAANRVLQKVTGSASLLAHRYGVISQEAMNAAHREKMVWDEARARKNAEKGHLKAAREAYKEVGKRGKDVEHVGMVDKELHARMQRGFPPMLNREMAEANREVERANRAKGFGRVSVADRLRKAGRVVKDWVW